MYQIKYQSGTFENKSSFIIGTTSFFDAMVLNEEDEVNYVVNRARQMIQSGGVVILEKPYQNEPPVIVAVIEDEESLNQWAAKTDDLQQWIKRNKKR
ncbi:hypothetical protein [Brevibacillus parabrevis]|uniref:Uncharacterized protein n=1 Tax=Brevibacillus parabrevis TaxID=54914 RepID=A0A4Y3PN48_BREPA|nr:hypothetical protein [Brevibacillus parabrevis]RNB95016.1 hypothetical protein EDM60_14200 [Brevibacillus parabrevis]GEB35890.1 hypothetical protein BPA01_54700 [Brevibacillus parabrevis]